MMIRAVVLFLIFELYKENTVFRVDIVVLPLRFLVV